MTKIRDKYLELDDMVFAFTSKIQLWVKNR